MRGVTTGVGYRPDRLASAWRLVKSGRVERLGDGHFRVAGNVESSYDVDLNGDQMCFCLDQYHRGDQIKHMCKHVLACRLAQLDPALLGVIGDALLAAEQRAKDATKRARKVRAA